MVKSIHKALEAGFKGVAEIYAIADRRVLGCTRHTFSLQELVEGEDLRHLPLEEALKYTSQAEAIVKSLHNSDAPTGTHIEPILYWNTSPKI